MYAATSSSNASAAVSSAANHASAAAASSSRTMHSFFTSNRAASSTAAASVNPTPASIPSSRAFEHPATSSPHRSPANSRSNSAGSSGSRGRKRGHGGSQQSEDHSADDAMEDADAAATLQMPPPLTTCKLASRTLLYQLHVLHPEEKLVLSGVGGAAGVEMLVQTTKEEDEQLQPRGDLPQVAKPAPPNPSTMDEECKGEPASSSVVDESSADTSTGSLEPLSADLPPYSRSLFPDSLDYVRLFLSASQAHRAFLALQQQWRAKGVKNVKERIMELQLTQPAKVLVIATEAQRQQWLQAQNGAADASDTMMAATTTVRHSPFYSTPIEVPCSPTIAPASSSVATAAPSTSPGSSSTPAAALPSLYSPPTLSSSLRSLLAENEDALDGFCISVATVAGVDSVVSMDLTARMVADGEVILRASVCAQRLHLLDDDKKGRWNQQLLTDLFGRMDVDRRSNHAAAASSSTRAADSLYDADMQQAISASLSGYHTTAAGPSFSSLGATPASSNGFQLAPSSFSASLRAASEQLFASATAGAMNSRASATIASHHDSNDAMSM